MREVTKSVLKFCLGFLFVLLISALLAPWIYHFCPFFKFDRILRRLIMIGTLILVFKLLRNRWQTFGNMGFQWTPESFPLFKRGFGTGIVLVVGVSLVQLALGARVWHLYQKDIWHWIGFFFKGLGAGLLIGLIEEFFFRGFLFLTLKDLWNTKWSLVVTNLIYALVHFFPGKKPPIGQEPTFWDSLHLLGHVGPSIWQSPKSALAVLGLFLFGLTLSFAFLRTGSLYASIGIHAGSVFCLKLNRRFVPDVAGKMGSLLAGSKNLYDGIAGLVLLLTACIWVSRIKMKRKSLAFLATLFLILAPVSLSAGEKEEIKNHRQTYSLIQNLSQAQVLREANGRIYEGRWQQNRFHFEGLPPVADVAISQSIPVDGRIFPVIWLQPFPRFETTFVFPGISGGGKMQFFFALPDATFRKEIVTPVYVEAWIGKKELFKVRLNAKGWVKKTFDLTLPSLLRRSYSLTLKIRTSDNQPKVLVFYGYTE